MAPKALPPPRPDPLTLDQIYACLTSRETSLSEKAYHLVALNSVAFNPTVKLFLFEEPLTSKAAATDHDAAKAAAEAARQQRSRRRREALLQSVAAFLAQRNNAICEECQWETVALLGELCRMEGGGSSGGSGALQPAVASKLNACARLNLEYLAQLPWFVPAVHAIMGSEAVAAFEAAETRHAAAKDKVNNDANAPVEEKGCSDIGGSTTAASSTPPASTHTELRKRLHERQKQRQASNLSESGTPQLAVDQDVVIVLQDILRALPKIGAPNQEGEASTRPTPSPASPPATGAQNSQPVFVWTKRNLEQAHDLMFLDASPSAMSNLIPLVSRLSSQRCSHCLRYAEGAKPSQTSGENTGKVQAEEPKKEVFSRCSSCKAVYYCSIECQKANWAAVHGIPCKSYKERCEAAIAQHNMLTNSSRKARKNKGLISQDEGPLFKEVPLEPSLFFETRHYLYDHRDSSFAGVSYNDYFMKYTVRGT